MPQGGPSPEGKRKWGSTTRAEGEWGGAAAKKRPRIEERGGKSELEPFDYEGVHYTDFTEGMPIPNALSKPLHQVYIIIARVEEQYRDCLA